jgi:hypothetical protein
MPTVSLPDFAGEYYREFLRRLHAVLRPGTYFEIGTERGNTLALARCPSIAVDPVFRIHTGTVAGEVFSKPSMLFYQMTSDAFFSAHDPQYLFGRTIDLAFLDGAHRCEILLRDFINTEKSCSKKSVVILHDCLPLEEGLARRSQAELAEVSEHRKDWWTGDVWRTALLLKRKRRDLRIVTVDAQPTGLVLITNLDPKSQTLTQAYYESVQEMLRWSLADGGLQALHAELAVTSTKQFLTEEQFSRYFWI